MDERAGHFGNDGVDAEFIGAGVDRHFVGSEGAHHGHVAGEALAEGPEVADVVHAFFKAADEARGHGNPVHTQSF